MSEPWQNVIWNKINTSTLSVKAYICQYNMNLMGFIACHFVEPTWNRMAVSTP